jgi:hypothetical protein
MYETGLRRLQAALDAGSISQETFARQSQLIEGRYQAGLAAPQKNEQAIRSLTSTTGGFGVQTAPDDVLRIRHEIGESGMFSVY